MGNLQFNSSNFKWIDKYELIDLDQNDHLLKLMSRVGESEYIGKQIVCSGQSQIQKMQAIIDKKILNPCPYIIKLVRVGYKIQNIQCNQNKTFCLVFKKPMLTLKQDSIYRKFQKSPFTEQDIEYILESSIKGLHYLYQLGQLHGKVSADSIYLNEDRTIVVGDPWLLRNEGELKQKLNSNVYPSPQKILFDKGYIQSIDLFLSDLFSLGIMILELYFLQHMDILYQKGYRRLVETQLVAKINQFCSSSLKSKLQLILSPSPNQRKQILKFYLDQQTKSSKFIELQKQSFKKQYIQNSLVTSQVKTVKIKGSDNYNISDHFRLANNSQNGLDFSIDTIPQHRNNQPLLNPQIKQHRIFVPQKTMTPIINQHPHNLYRINQFTFNRYSPQQEEFSVKSISSIEKQRDSDTSKDNIPFQFFQQYKYYVQSCKERASSQINKNLIKNNRESPSKGIFNDPIESKNNKNAKCQEYKTRKIPQIQKNQNFTGFCSQSSKIIKKL